MLFKISKPLMALSLSFTTVCFATTPSTYQNMYIAYASPNNVNAIVKYASQLGIHNFFFYTYGEDMPYDDAASLLQAVNNTDANAVISGYWDDWEIYKANDAIPSAPYTLSNNTDLSDKLAHSNTITYAFLETEVDTFSNAYRNIDHFKNAFVTTPGAYGSLYFFDPYADLTTTDAFCINPPAGVPTSTDPKIASANLLCDYVPLMIDKATNQSYSYTDFASFGNFETFAHLATSGKNGQPINKVISVGGYGHNESFESIFAPPSWTGISQTKAMTNFANSAKAIMDTYNINGIDLDYENPQMTLQQSEDYFNLVKILSTALQNDNGKYITIAVMSNPAYLKGNESGGIGFDPNYQGNGSVLKQIAALPNVKLIDLMTYDFHGSWDYSPTGPGPGKTGVTGFLNNLHMPSNAPTDQIFSVDTSIAALSGLGVAYTQIGVGIPAYGRSFANVDQGQDGTGLFSPLTASTLVPAGDLDTANCSTDISNPTCFGTFSYRFIVTSMLGKGFTDHDTTDSSSGNINGTTAYAPSWSVPQPANYNLTINNADSAVGINVNIGSFISNYQGSGVQQIYTTSSNPSTSAIEAQNNLSISWTYWGTGQGKCTSGNGAQPFNFNKDTAITISSINPNGGNNGTATCTITQTP